MPPRALHIDRQLGDKEEIIKLKENLADRGGAFYLYLDPQAALIDEKGYSPQNDLAMSITNSNLVGFNRNKINYYLNLDAISSRYSSLSQDVFSDLDAGLALDGITKTLYSDFKTNHNLNREEAILAYQSLLETNRGTTALYLPNDYLFRYMEAYYDIPLSNSGYIYTTDAVPFIQIVLSGYVPYYGTALNFASNSRDDLLRHVDFGIYPSYFLTYEETAKILNTGSNWIYTSSHLQWSEEIETTYRWLNNLLGPVKGHQIIARDVLADGVTATTYSNGMRLIVNYNNDPYYTDSLIVNGKDAVITEVTP